MKAKAPASLQPNNGKIVSAQGCRRFCALPNYEHFAKRMGDQRGWRLQYAYSEYVAACREAGERPYAYSSFCAGLRGWRREMGAAGIPEWYPGEYMRTYWSRGSAQIAGEQVAFPVFVAAMAYSDVTFLYRADDMGTKSWMACCQRAFRSLGGVPYVTDCAQCKVSATARSTIEAFARHCRTVLYGARPKTAKGAEGAGKPLDARTVSYVARKVIEDVAGMDFASFEDLDAYVEGKLVAYNAIGSEGGPARWTLFKERELPQMLELPSEDADFATWSTRIVRDDYHFVVDGVRYSAPWRCSNEEVRVSWTDGEVRSYLNGELVARHERMTEMRGRCTVTDPAHRPPGHRWFAKRMDDRFLVLAREEGANVVRVMKHVLSACKKEGKGFRACKELIDLRKTPSAAGVTLDEACRAVLDGGGEIGVAEVMEKLVGDAE